MFFKGCYTVLFLFLACAGYAQSLKLTDEGEVTVKGQMTHRKDELGTITFDQIRKEEFQPLQSIDKSPSFGFDTTVHWFKFQLSNVSSHHNWLLEVAFAPLDKIDFYLEPDSGNVWLHKTTGDIFPISQRDLPHRHPIFKFSVPSGKTKQAYLRVKTTSSVQVPVTLWTPENFHNASYRTQLINGLFYGAMLLMTLYQFFLFLSIRDKSTFYYVLTLLAMAAVIALFQGYDFLYLHPEAPWLNDWFATFNGPVFVLFSALLTRSFLNLRQFSRWLDNLILLNMALNILASALILIFIHKLSYKYLHFFVLIHSMLVLISAAYCLYRKYRPALYYLMAWATLLLAAVAFTMGNLGILPGYLGTNYQGLMIGCILQVLMITFALGERWNVLIKENQRAKELELKREQEEKEKLEREVQLRTEEIQHQNKKLEEVNHIKDKLFSVVSHDIRGPLSSLQITLELAKSGIVNQEEFLKISAEIEKHLHQTNEFIQNLLHWAKLQLQGESFEPSRLDIASVADEALALMEPELRFKNIRVENSLPQALVAYADINMVRSVLRNLLTNAIKFTPIDGMVTIGGRINDNNQLIISVADNGIGIPSAHRDLIFTLKSVTTQGTQQETGTGLGLMLCKEFIEKNGGSIWFESQEGKGTVFFFTLPEFNEEEAMDYSISSRE